MMQWGFHECNDDVVDITIIELEFHAVGDLPKEGKLGR